MSNAMVLTDVTTRDGLQALKTVLPTHRKLALVEDLIVAGCRRLEVASFVSQKLVPTMADADELCAQLPRREGVEYGGVVLDVRGMERLMTAQLDWAGVVVAASDTFLMRNQRCDRAGALDRVADIERMRRGTPTRISGYVSCCFACPYEGPTNLMRVVELCDAMLQLGVDDVYLADTTGRGTAPATRRLLQQILAHVPVERVGCHFHDTHGQAIANLDAALLAGVRKIDAAVAGLGGCMFAPGATGNVASEDVLTLLSAHEIETDIDVEQLARTGRSLCEEFKVPNESKAGRALLAAQRMADTERRL